MKTVKLCGPNLKTQLAIAITGSENASLSVAIEVNFVENGESQKGKLLLHTKNPLHHKSMTDNILCFTGTIVNNNLRRPCMGCYYTKDVIEECWMTIIEMETEIFKVYIGKTEFIKQCKEYYRSQGFKFTEDGNLVDGFPPSRNLPKPGDLIGVLINLKGVDVSTEMYKNLFPIVRKKGEIKEIIFGEFIEEYTIKTCSAEEAKIRGVIIR